MSQLTKRQKAILDFISSYSEKNGYQPSYREMGDAVGLKSPSSVNYQLTQLEDKGHLRRTLGNQRAIRLKTLPGEPASFTSIAFETGRIMAREEVITGLKKLRVLRDSMLGDRWLVIYTEDGPIDITREQLLEALSKEENK